MGASASTAVSIASAIYIFNIWNGIFNVQFIHSHIPITYGRWVDRILVSPIIHQVHHGKDVPHRDKNFGNALSLFDWIFGTWYRPRKGEVIRYGIKEGDPGFRNVFEFYWLPFQRASRILLKKGAER